MKDGASVIPVIRVYVHRESVEKEDWKEGESKVTGGPVVQYWTLDGRFIAEEDFGIVLRDKI